MKNDGGGEGIDDAGIEKIMNGLKDLPALKEVAIDFAKYLPLWFSPLKQMIAVRKSQT